jgi:salicylate hydroxylase
MSAPKILIAGAGIGGLTAGLALLRKGFDVTIYERASELKEVGAGLHISPNGSRVLFSLGLGPKVEASSRQPERRVMRLWNTGEGWPLPNQTAMAIERYGAPYLLMHRGDLHAILVDAVQSAKRDAIMLNAECVGFDQDGREVTLHLADGSLAKGDALISADGIKSTLRRALFGPDHPRFTGSIYWRGLVPIERVPERSRAEAAGWMGPKNFATIYPVSVGRLLNINASARRDDWSEESWTAKGDREEFAQDFAGWHSDVQQIIHAIDQPYRWGSFLRDPLKQWSVGRVTLLGDACHPMLASLGQGANMAIEDGCVLASCLAQAGSDVEGALRAYEGARIARTTRVVEASNKQSGMRLNEALYDPEQARAYMDSVWGAGSVSNIYDWIFEYDATRAAA